MKKWCIKVTEENLPIVGKWFNEYNQNLTDNFIDDDFIGYYLHYPIRNNKSHSSAGVEDGYTELTFEQFKEQILKEPKVLNDILDKILDKQYEYIDTLRKEVVNVQDIKNIFLEYGIKSEPKF